MLNACSTSTNTKDEGKIQHDNCGCGMKDCGASPCFVAFPIQSPVINDIVESLGALSTIVPNNGFPTASDILAQLSLMTRRKSDTIDNPIAEMHSFLYKQQYIKDIPVILQFWNGGDHEVANNQHECRGLPPVILLLLLKLLYSSPLCGSFLQLACISIPYIAARFPTQSSEGRILAKQNKSHWAYYVFILHLILGERVKKHRKGKVIHQTPVWDVVFGLDKTQRVYEERKDDSTISSSCYNKVLQMCSLSSYQHPIPSIITRQPISSSFVHPPLYVIGDSHVLSLAWQTLCINTDAHPIYRTAYPFPSTGLKAWHVRPSTNFFTHYNLNACLQRLPKSSTCRTIILSAGEIDCREGIGGKVLQGYYQNCSDAVENTGKEFLTSLAILAEEYKLQILVMPVAPHAYRSEKNGKSTGRAKRRETMHLWNEVLRTELARKRRRTNISSDRYTNVFILDYEETLRHPDTNSPVGYVLNSAYNADYTHVNSAIVPLVEEAILQSGCDTTLL